MPHKYSLRISGKDNLERGVSQAAIFKDRVELVFYKDDKQIKTASLSAAQTALSNTLQSTKDKIALFCQRLGIDESQLEYDRSSIKKPENIIYKVLGLGRKLIDAFVPAQWIIVYKKENDQSWKKIIPNSKVFQADPFIIYKDDKYYIFYEELQFKDWYGYLMVAELDLEKGCLINEKIILKKDYHLSYPSVFEENGTYYMIPESSEGHTVDLYECEDFPYQWKKKKTLLGETGDDKDIQVVDTTVLKTEQGWYLFTTVIKKGVSCNDELSIYKSDDLLTEPFEKLYDEPVITDVTNARMGGHFIKKDNGDIYRIAQNCGKRYGHKANFNKILQIEKHGDGSSASAGDYKEELVDTIKANFPAFSFHTYNQDHDLIVADMEIPRFDLYSLKRFTWVQIKRVFGK